MSKFIVSAAIAGAVLIASFPAHAQRAGSGPVGQSCADDLAAYCAGVPHGAMRARNCLEENRARLSAACRRALDNTGGGRGFGRNRQGSN
jgi:hypothetical protein